MDQPPAIAFTAFADVWPRAAETEIGAALCAIGAGKDFDFDRPKMRLFIVICVTNVDEDAKSLF